MDTWGWKKKCPRLAKQQTEPTKTEFLGFEFTWVGIIDNLSPTTPTQLDRIKLHFGHPTEKKSGERSQKKGKTNLADLREDVHGCGGKTHEFELRNIVMGSKNTAKHSKNKAVCHSIQSLSVRFT